MGKRREARMKEIDIEWLQRIDSIHQKFNRTIPLKSFSSRCTKEILIDRYFRFLEGRTFKLRIPTNESNYVKEENITYEIFYALFTKTKHTTVFPDEGKEKYHYSYGIQKYLSWNDHEFTISFRDEKLNHQSFKLHWNDILRITYEEIPTEKYWEIVSLFIEPKKEEHEQVSETTSI